MDGRSVLKMSANALTSLSRRTVMNGPPTLSLESQAYQTEVQANSKWGYGFTVKGLRPTVVASVDPPGPAYEAGIREGEGN